jgi:hypothetical protein
MGIKNEVEGALGNTPRKHHSAQIKIILIQELVLFKNKNPYNVFRYMGLSKMEPMRFELTTSCMPCRRSPN